MSNDRKDFKRPRSTCAPVQHDIDKKCLIEREERPWPRRTDANYLGDCVSTIITTTSDQQSSIYGVSVFLKLPFKYALTLNVMLQMYLVRQLRFVILEGSSISLSHLVDEEHSEFMIACRKGDCTTIKHMLRHRLAGVNDTTVRKGSPLGMAIRSGRSEAVELLLQFGADVNGVYGNNQSSPLVTAVRLRHFNIARLLLSRGACCQYTTAWGWSPLWYLWADMGLEISPPADEFIDLFSSRDDFLLSHTNMVDIQGYGMIHHAVIFGQPEDVVSLINRGVNPYIPSGILERDAIENAVFENRPDVFDALLPYYQHRSIDKPDKRGWTLLHTAASEGHDQITRHLLRLGANWQALSEPSYFELPECLQGKRFTPIDAAMGIGGVADGHRRRNLFLQAVADVNGINIHTVEPPKDADDIWFDAS